MLAVAVIAAVLFVPGLLLCRLAGCRENPFLVSITFSLALYLCLFWGVRRLDLDIIHLGAALAGAAGVIGSLLAVRRRRLPAAVSWAPPSLFTHRLGPGVLSGVVAGPGIYHLVAGVYDELPADFYQHLNFVNFAWHRLGSHGFSQYGDSLFNLMRAENPWYVLLAWSP